MLFLLPRLVLGPSARMRVLLVGPTRHAVAGAHNTTQVLKGVFYHRPTVLACDFRSFDAHGVRWSWLEHTRET